VSVRLSVRLYVTFVDHVKTNKDIFEIFSPSGSQAILVFPCQTGWRYSDWNSPPLTGASNGGGVARNRDSERISGTCGISSTPVYRVTLIGVFFGHFRINLHQTCTQYSTATLERSPISKNHFLNLEFCRRKTVVCEFSSP